MFGVIGFNCVWSEMDIRLYEELNILPFCSPLDKEFVSYDARFKSFENNKYNLDAARFSSAGFYFIKVWDFVKCHVCNITLMDWNKNDEPWLVHTYFSPECVYVLLNRGEKFVKLVRELGCGHENNHLIHEIIKQPSDNIRLLCQICMSNEINVLYIPCNHLICCSFCACSCKNCGICREPITGLMRIFLS